VYEEHHAALVHCELDWTRFPQVDALGVVALPHTPVEAHQLQLDPLVVEAHVLHEE
jgi:hypothetical protein